MDLQNLQLVFCNGYAGSRIGFVKNDTICYHTNNCVKLVTSDGKEQNFTNDDFAAKDIAFVAVHPYDRVFAVVERCTKPAIHIYSLSWLKKVSKLEDGAKLEYLDAVFSTSMYFATVSGVPEFELTVWNYVTGAKLINLALSVPSLTSISFNPTNWRELCIMTKDAVKLCLIEQCDTHYVAKEEHVWLPPFDAPMGHRESEPGSETLQSREATTRASTRISKQSIDLPLSSVAGLREQTAIDRFDELMRNVKRMLPVSHTWDAQGDLLVGCESAQLVKIDMELRRAKVLYNPLTHNHSPTTFKESVLEEEVEAENQKDQAADKETEAVDSAAEQRDIVTGLLTLQVGDLRAIAFSKKGLLAADTTGIVRLFDLDKSDRVSAITVMTHLDVPNLVQIVLNDRFSSLAACSAHGLIKLHKIIPDDVGSLLNQGGSAATSANASPVASTYPLVNVHHTRVVGLDSVGPDHNCVVTVREDGCVQIWNAINGRLLSAASTINMVDGTLSDRATVLASNPMHRLVVVGTHEGHLKFVHVHKSNQTRVVHVVRLFRAPVRFMQFDEFGDFLVCCSTDGRCYLLSGLASKSFDLLGYTDVPENVVGLALFRESATASLRVLLTAQVTTKKDRNAMYTKAVLFEVPYGIQRSTLDYARGLEHQFVPEKISKVQIGIAGVYSGAAFNQDASAFVTVCERTKRLLLIDVPAYTAPAANAGEKEGGSKPKRRADKALPAARLRGVFPSQHDVAKGVQVALSTHHGWLLSYGSDGYVVVHELVSAPGVASSAGSDAASVHSGGESQTEQTPLKLLCRMPCETYLDGGIRCARLTTDGSHVLTCGSKPFFSLFKWKDSSLAAASKRAFAGSADALSDALRLEDELLEARSTWRSDSPNSLLKELQLNAERSKSNMAEIYLTPLASVPEDATWLEIKRVQEIHEEDKQYADVKRGLRGEIADIRRTLLAMMKRNETLPELERLNAHEFELDVEEQAKQATEVESEVQKLRETIETDILAKQYLRDLLKKECFDAMSVKGKTVNAFNVTFEVSNYPQVKRSSEELERIKLIIARRKIEKAELAARKEIAEVEVDSAREPVEKMVRDKFNLPAEEEQEEDATQTKDQLALKEAAQRQQLLSGGASVQMLGYSEALYDQFELHTREQKVVQMELVQDMIYRIRESFNKEFDDLYTRKEQEIAKIKEKNKRINKILADLDLLNEVQSDPEMNDSEKPELLLLVDDSEVKAERYLTADQRKKLEKEKAEREEMEAKQRADNWRERGLFDMMDGVLEVKKEDELKKDIPVPGFIKNKQPEEWNEDEKKAAKDYEEKCRVLSEEREKFRKQLEAELKKLRGFIEESKQAFDDTVQTLFARKIQTEKALYEEELKVMRLRYSMLIEDELAVREQALLTQLAIKKQGKTQKAQQVQSAKKTLEMFQNSFETLQAEDKVLEKSFKKEFPEVSNAMVEQLFKFYRRRPRKTVRNDVALVEDFSVNNPYAERPPTARTQKAVVDWLEQALKELDAPENAPEGLDRLIWERMCDLRKQKVLSENRVKQQAQTLIDIKTFLQRRQEEDERLKREVQDLEITIERLREERNKFLYNLEVQLVMKQGQVEVDANVINSLLIDYRDSILIDRTQIETLNAEIKKLGKQKIDSMNKAKDFKKGIVQLEWEHEKMRMQLDDLEQTKRDIQMQKVTREIQRYLTTEDYAALIQKEIQTLEQTVQKLKTVQGGRMKELERAFRNVDEDINDKSRENDHLIQQLTELNVLRSERYHIDQVNADRRDELNAAQQRYNEIVQRRRLIDVAKQQAQEVAVLRAEVERLRMRTFPALVQLD